jgi:hypothetical protein
MDKLRKEQKQRGTAFDINVSITSACTVKALKVSLETACGIKHELT